MRSFTTALLALAVAVPVGIATVPAHADNNGFVDQAHRFFNSFGDRNNSNGYERGRQDEMNRENARGGHDRYGWNGDRNRGNEAWNRDRSRRDGEQYGYNNRDEHHWDRNGNNFGDNGRYNRYNNGDHD